MSNNNLDSGANDSPQPNYTMNPPSQLIEVQVNDYSESGKHYEGIISPIKTELARSIAQSTDKDINDSSYAVDETPNQHQQPQYGNANIINGQGGQVRRQKLDINNLLHKTEIDSPHPMSPIPQGTLYLDDQVRGKLYTQQQNGPQMTSNGDVTVYLTNPNDVGVQSNGDNIETRLTSTHNPEVPKVTMNDMKKSELTNTNESQNSKMLAKNLPTPVKFPREGSHVAAVDFMDLNKTMINFATTQRQSQATAAEGRFEQSVLAGEETKDVSGSNSITPKLKQNGAFRHTEYAKGFYKVNAQGAANVGATQQAETIGTISGMASAEKEMMNTTGFSEVERSNVLDNQSRKPLGTKIFGQNKKGSQMRNVVPIHGITSEVSGFNSTQDTSWFKQNRKGLEGKSPPPQFGYHQRNKKGSNSKDTGSHFDGGVQTVDPIISFGRAIGPGGSLQPKIEKKKFKTIDHPELKEIKVTGVLSEGGKKKNRDRDNKMDGFQQVQMPSIVDNEQPATSGSFTITQKDKKKYSHHSQTLSSRNFQKRNVNMHNTAPVGSQIFPRRNNSVVTTPMMTMGIDTNIGNFGHPVHLACPKDFTLTPVHKLEPMGYDLTKLPRDMQISCQKEQTDVHLVRQRLRRQRFDHLNYDPFVNTQDGMALYNGVLKEEKDEQGRAVVELSDDEDEPKNLYAYLIKNDLIKRQTKKRGDPIETVTRRDFGKHKEEVQVAKKAKPFNKIKELKQVFARTDIPIMPIAKINDRINEYTKRQNTKEYLGSWLHQRRGIDKKLDEGYRVYVGDDAESELPNYMKTGGGTFGKLGVRQSGANIAMGGDIILDAQKMQQQIGELDVLSRVPSQKLSVLIHRKNAAMRKEQRLREKELLKSQLDSTEEDFKVQERQMNEILRLDAGGNQSERTIQAIKNTSQMILPTEKNVNKNSNGKMNNYPPWMVNSQIVSPQQFGTSRVVTRKLNQVIKNPPSLASMGLKNTIVANLNNKSKSKKRQARNMHSQIKSVVSTSMPRQTITSEQQQYQNTMYSTAYNADMPEAQEDHKPGSPNSQTTDGPTDIMTFTMQETQHHQYSRQKTDQGGKSQMKLDEPSYFEINNQPNILNQQPLSPQKLNLKQMDQAVEILDKTSPGGKAIQILQKYWEMPAQAGQQIADPTESIFSSEVPPKLNSQQVMALVSSDQTITIKDQEQMMDQISNYSVSQIEIPDKNLNVNQKYYDCIEEICNFQERIPSDLIQQKRKTTSPAQQLVTSQTSQNIRASKGDGELSTSTMDNADINIQKLEMNNDMSKLSQLDVVVEHVAGNSDINSNGNSNGAKNSKFRRPQVEHIATDMRSDVFSDQNTNTAKEGQSAAGYDMTSSVRNTQVTGMNPSLLSRGSRVQRKILGLLKSLMDKIREQQEEGNPEQTTVVSSNQGGVVNAEMHAPQSVPQTSFYQPNQQLENFLLERLGQVLELREDTLAIEENISDFLHFKEFNSNENIMQKLISQKTQMAVNHDLFETEEACSKFNEEKRRQTITQKEQRATLTLWNYDAKSKTRAFSLEPKMQRKEPLDMGVNSRDPSQPIIDAVDSRLPHYDVHMHFDKVAKLCHNMLSDMNKDWDEEKQEYVKKQPPHDKDPLPKMTQRPKPTSNNLKLDNLGGDERKYLVLTLQELLKIDQSRPQIVKD